MLAAAEATGPQDEVRALVELLVTPLLEVPHRQGATHHARFLEQVRNHPAVTDNVQLAAGDLPAVRIVLTRLERALSELPPPLRRPRSPHDADQRPRACIRASPRSVGQRTFHAQPNSSNSRMTRAEMSS